MSNRNSSDVLGNIEPSQKQPGPETKNARDEGTLVIPDLPLGANPTQWPDEAQWAAGAKVDLVMLDGSGQHPDAPTRVRLLTNGGILLAQFDCRDPDAGHLIYGTRGRDSARLFLGDCVEIYLQTGRRAFHVAINPGGGCYDAEVIDGRDDPAWDPPLRVEAHTTAEGWQCALALPLKSIFDPEAGEQKLECRANIGRLRAGRKNAFREETGWRPTGGQRFQAEEALGRFIFQASPQSVAQASMPAASIFIDPARPTVAAQRGAPGPLQADDIPPAGPHTIELRSDESAPSTGPVTRARIFQSDDALIVRTHCAEADMAGIVAPPDKAQFWLQDAMEIYLAPGHKESNDYRQFSVNAAGAVRMELGRAAVTIEQVECKVVRGSKAWAVEIRVPLRAIGVNGEVPKLWGMNILRHRPARGGEYEAILAWSPITWPPDDPEKFGTLVVGEVSEGDSKQEKRDRLEACPTGTLDFNVFTRERRAKLDLPEMVHNHLTAIRDAQYARLDELRGGITSWEQWLPIRQKIRENFMKSIGLPQKFNTPLNVKITRAVEAEGVCIERVLFQSRPNFYVTANLYRPSNAGGKRLPGILRVVGHYKAGKFKDEYVRQLVELAGDGYVILILDMPEHGERTYTANGFGAHNVTSSHYITAMPCMLTASNLAGYMVNDIMRGLDYLLGREDVDAKQIVMTGCSGGGTLTGYVAALDERITAAAPISAWGAFKGLGRQGYDPEQNLHDAQEIGLDGEGQLMMIAPRPLCTIVECYNPARRQHTEQIYERIRRFYNMQNAGSRLEYRPTGAPHGVCAEHWRLFREWLERTYPSQRKASPTRFEVPIETLRVTRTGQAYFDRDLADRNTVADLNHRRIELRLAFNAGLKDRASTEAHREQIAATLRQLLHFPHVLMTPAAVERVSHEQIEGLRLEKIILQPEPGIYLPAIFIKQAESSQKTPKKLPVVIHFSQRGKRHILRQRWSLIQSLAASGISALAVDLRGTGETDPGGDRAFTGPAQCLDNFGYAVSRLVIGMRVRDVLACADYCRGREDVAGDRIALLGDNLAAPNPPHIRQLHAPNDPGLEQILEADTLGPTVALMAAALDGRFAAAACIGPLGSYADLASRSYFYHPTSVLVPKILKNCDLPDIAAAIAPRPLLLAGALNGLNQEIGAAALHVFAATRRAYDLHEASAKLHLTDRSGEATLAFLCNIFSPPR